MTNIENGLQIYFKGCTRFFRKRPEEVKTSERHIFVLNNKDKYSVIAIFHSDRGSQYTSEAFKKTHKEVGLIQSLSGTGHCFDNARMESFFATKKEKIYRVSAYKLTQKEVKSIIFRYLFVYDNRIRISSVNPGGMMPVIYREWVKSKKLSAA